MMIHHSSVNSSVTTRLSLAADAVLLLAVVWVFSGIQPYVAIVLFCMHALVWSQLIKGFGQIGMKATRTSLLRKLTALVLVLFFVLAALTSGLPSALDRVATEVNYEALQEFMKWQGLPYIVVIGLMAAVMTLGVFSERKPPR